jgi:NADH:ubiquinone oxidoreductase subunit K
MNKKVTVVLIILALALIAYNVTIIDFSDPLGEESIIAVIGVVAALCAIVLLLILLTSRNIQKKIDEE